MNKTRSILLALIAALSLGSVAFSAPAPVKTTDAFQMREAIMAILKGHVTVTPGAKDQQPVVTLEPFDLTTDALLALGHNKRALNDSLGDLDQTRTDIMNANGVTGRSDDTRESVLKANKQWSEALKRVPTVKVDLEAIPLDGLGLSKNKLDNDAVFDVLGSILKR